MRRLATPFQGFVGDADMAVYWKMTEPEEAADYALDHSPAAAHATRRDVFSADFDSQFDSRPSLFNPLTGDKGAYSFATVWFQSQPSSPVQDHGIFAASTSWSAAVWYSLGTAATQCLVEYSGTAGGTGSTGLAMRLEYLGLQQGFVVRFQTGGGTIKSLSSPTGLATTGLIGVDVTADASSTTAVWYHQGKRISVGGTNFASGAGQASSTSARWSLGASVHAGTSYSSAGLFLEGQLSELAIWKRALGDRKHEEIYGSCRIPWDEGELIASNSHRVRCRVLVEDSAGTMQDLSDFDGQDWVSVVDINEAVDDQSTKAQVQFMRRRGNYADLSPLNNTPDYAGLIDLRRKVLIERAIVPALWTMQGWEWRVRYEGYVEDWSVNQDTVIVNLTDQSGPVNDAFVMDVRQYNYYDPNKAAEDVQEEILSDYEPILKTQESFARIGYKGFDSAPRIYSVAGTAASRHYHSSQNILRYNDVSTGPVYGAVQAVTDMIGHDTRFLFHEPWQTHRLTNYSPRRVTLIRHELITRLALTSARIDFSEPHGLALDVPLTVAGTASHNFSGTVSSVNNYYSVVLTGSTASLPAGTTTAGSVTFQYNYALAPEQIRSADQVASSVRTIRNHAVVKFQRIGTVATRSISTIERDINGILTIVVDGDLGSLDPDNLGIQLELKTAPTAASLNGSYSGVITGRHTITTTVPGALSADTFTESLPFLSSEYLSFREVVSTSTPSVSAYGYLPCGVYEGTSLAINTEAEAQRLADNLISDLAFPTADLVLSCPILPFEDGDVVLVPLDPKGRWSEPQEAAITSVQERYRGGSCEALYGIRFSVPTRGTKWAQRVVINPLQPGWANNNAVDILEQASAWVPGNANLIGRSVALNLRQPARREMSLRRDQTEVWMSTTPNFIPTESNRVGLFRGERINISYDADGNALSPGTTYYVRFAERDIYGNLSAITGMGLASLATVPAIVPRFLTQVAGCLAVASSGATLPWASTFTPILADVDNGTDESAISYDTFNNYSTSSRLFRAPADGVYVALHEGSWSGSKVSNQVRGRVGHFNGSMATLGYSEIRTTATFAANGVIRFGFSETVSCQSGDFLRVEAASDSGDITLLRGTTASRDFCKVSFTLVNQR